MRTASDVKQSLWEVTPVSASGGESLLFGRDRAVVLAIEGPLLGPALLTL
jgi:hypothetical protein